MDLIGDVPSCIQNLMMVQCSKMSIDVNGFILNFLAGVVDIRRLNGQKFSNLIKTFRNGLHKLLSVIWNIVHLYLLTWYILVISRKVYKIKKQNKTLTCSVKHILLWKVSYIFFMVYLKKQIFTYLLEIMSSLKLKRFASIMQIVSSQSDLSANFSNNLRRYR